MNLAISNIAWRKEEEPMIADMLVHRGIHGVEVAPTKIWQNPTEVTPTEIMTYRQFWNAQGIEIVALQSLLFGRADLQLFQGENSRREMAEYLKKMITLAAALGAKVLVFGSPKNRQRGTITFEAALDTARDFFYELGTFASSHGVNFCIEPNASQYACDFVTTSVEGKRLVEEVESPGFGLHLDLACMMLEREDVSKALSDGMQFLRHVHVSAPNLGNVAEVPMADLSSLVSTLAQLNYKHWVSIEMREQAKPDQGNLEYVKSALEAVLF